MISIPKFFQIRIFFCPSSKCFIPISFSFCKRSFFVFKIFISFRNNVKIFISWETKIFLCFNNSFCTKRSTVNISSILFWSTFSDDRFEHNQRWFIATRFCFIDKFYHSFNIIHITTKNLPAVSFITFCNIISKCDVSASINRNFIFVIENNKFSKFKITSK